MRVNTRYINSTRGTSVTLVTPRSAVSHSYWSYIMWILIWAWPKVDHSVWTSEEDNTRCVQTHTSIWAGSRRLVNVFEKNTGMYVLCLIIVASYLKKLQACIRRCFCAQVLIGKKAHYFVSHRVARGRTRTLLMLLYVHRDRKAKLGTGSRGWPPRISKKKFFFFFFFFTSTETVRDGEPRMATSTFPQLLSSEC